MTRFKCVVCGKLTAGCVPRDGDRSQRYPRRHDRRWGEVCPGIYVFAEWVEVPE